VFLEVRSSRKGGKKRRESRKGILMYLLGGGGGEKGAGPTMSKVKEEGRRNVVGSILDSQNLPSLVPF